MFFFDSLRSAWMLMLSLDPELVAVVRVSLTVSLVSTTLATLMGVPLGGVVGMFRFPGRGMVRILLHTLLAVPTVVIGLFVYTLISRRGVFGSFGLLYTQPAIIIGQTLLIAPLIAALVASAVERVDPRFARTARTLGAGPMNTALVVFREAMPAIAAALVTAFGRVISEIGISMMLGGNIRGFTRTMTTAMALEYDKGEFVLAVALGMILLAISLLINLVLAGVRKGGGRWSSIN